MGCGNNVVRNVPELQTESQIEQKDVVPLSSRRPSQLVSARPQPKLIDTCNQQRLRDYKRITYTNQKLYLLLDPEKTFKISSEKVFQFFTSVNLMFAVSLIQRFLDLTGFETYGPMEFQLLVTLLDYFEKYNATLTTLRPGSAEARPKVKQIITKGEGTLQMINNLLNESKSMEILEKVPLKPEQVKPVVEQAPDFAILLKQFSKLSEQQQEIFLRLDTEENFYLTLDQIYVFLQEKGYKGQIHDVRSQFYVKSVEFISPSDFVGILDSRNFPDKKQPKMVQNRTCDIQVLLKEFGSLSHDEQCWFMEADTLEEFKILPIYMFNYLTQKLRPSYSFKLKELFETLLQIRGDQEGAKSDYIKPIEFVQILQQYGDRLVINIQKQHIDSKLEQFIELFDNVKTKKSNDLATLLKEFGQLSDQLQNYFEAIDIDEQFMISPINLYNWMKQQGLQMKLQEYNTFIGTLKLNTEGQIRPSEFEQIINKFTEQLSKINVKSSQEDKLKGFAADFVENRAKKSNDFAVLLKEFGSLNSLLQDIFELVDEREEFLLVPLNLFNWMKKQGMTMKLNEFNKYIDSKNLNIPSQIRPSEFEEIVYEMQKQLPKVNLPPRVNTSRLNDMASKIDTQRKTKSNDLATLLKEFGQLSDQLQNYFEAIDIDEQFMISPINLYNWMKQQGLQMKLQEYNTFIGTLKLNTEGQIRPSEFEQIINKFTEQLSKINVKSSQEDKLKGFAADFVENRAKKSNDFAVLLKEFGSLNSLLQDIFELVDEREEFLLVPLNLFNWMKKQGMTMKLNEFNKYIDSKNLNIPSQIRPSEFEEIVYEMQKQLPKVNLPPRVNTSRLNDMASKIDTQRKTKSNDLATLLKEFGQLSDQLQNYFEAIDIDEQFMISPINLYNWMKQQGLQMKLQEYNTFIGTLKLNTEGQIRPSEFEQIINKFTEQLSKINVKSSQEDKLKGFAADFVENRAKKSNDFAVLLKEFGSLNSLLQDIFELVDEREEFLLVPLNLFNWMKKQGMTMKLNEFNKYIDSKNLNIPSQIRPSEFEEIVYEMQKQLPKVNLPPRVNTSRLNDMASKIDTQRKTKSNDLATLLKEFGQLSDQLQNYFEAIDIDEQFMISPINLYNWMKQQGLQMKLQEYNTFIGTLKLNTEGQIRPSEFEQIFNQLQNKII